jgi:hypothetical protein
MGYMYNSGVTTDVMEYGVHYSGGLYRLRCAYCKREFGHLYKIVVIMQYFNHIMNHYRRDPDVQSVLEAVLIELNKVLKELGDTAYGRGVVAGMPTGFSQEAP